MKTDNILDLPAPAALKHNPVEIDVGILALNRLSAPALDVLVDLLIELGDGAGRNPSTPQCLSDVFYSADRHTGQVHLHNRFFDRDIAAPVTLDDRRLEGLLPQLQHLDLDLTGLGVQFTGIAAGPGVHPVWRVFVTLGVTQVIGFGIQHGIQRLFDRAPDHLVQVASDLRFIDANYFTQRFRGVFFHGGPHWSVLLSWSTTVLTDRGHHLKICAKIIYVIDNQSIKSGFMHIIICATQRSGSTMVCDDFISTELLGNPREYFDPVVAEYRSKGQLPTAESLSKIKQQCTSDNGVSAIKVMANQFRGIGNIYKEMNLTNESSDAGFYEFYKESIWVKLVRKDAVSQAISRFMAIKTNIYHVKDGDGKSRIPSAIDNSNYNPEPIEFNFKEVDALVKSVQREYEEWDKFFNKYGITPIEVCYEDIVKDRSYLNKICNNAGVNIDTQSLPKRSIKKMAGSKSNDFKVQYTSKKENADSLM